MNKVGEFLEFCQLGDLDRILELLESSEPVDVNCADDDDNTALQIAAATGQEAAVGLLLRHGAAVDKANRYGWTPVMQAARQGNTAVADMLISHGATVNTVNKLGATALLCAVRSGVLSCVKLLVDHGAPVSSPGPELTPLMVAAQYGYTTVVKYLIDIGVEVDQRTKSAGLTALMFAAANGHKGTAQFLVECGADPKATNAGGKTVLHIAVARGKKQVSCYLGKTVGQGSSDAWEQADADIFAAIAHGNLSSVQRFVAEDASSANRTRKADGATPLALAATLGDLPAIELLLANGALVDAQDAKSGWTALMQAVFHGHREAALSLLQAGADTSIRDHHGYCALEIGSLSANSDVEFLRRLTPLYPQFSQSALNSARDSSERKRNWKRQLGAYLQQLKVRKPRTPEAIGLDPLVPIGDCELPRPDQSSRDLDSNQGASSKNPVAKLLLRMNTASPCRLALPSHSLRPVVLPLLSPYGLETSNAGRCVMPAAIALPECFSLEVLQELPSPESGGEATEADCDHTVNSQTVTGSMRSELKDELYDILESLSLERYSQLFGRQEIDAMAFALLTEEDLEDLGIDDTHARQKLAAAISKLRNAPS